MTEPRRPVRRPGPRPRPGPHRSSRRAHGDVRPARGASRPAPERRRAPGSDAGSTKWLRTLTILVARVGLAVVIVAVFVFGVFPTGRYLEHRDELERARTELFELEAENARLAQSIELLNTDAEIERVARAEYDMVLPGEEVYAVLPPAGN